MLSVEELSDRRPVRPRLNQLIETVAWTGSWRRLSMAKQRIVLLYFPKRYTVLDQILNCLYRSRAWIMTNKIANHANSDALRIVRCGMRTVFAPSSSFVNVSIFANQKIVTYVLPAFLVHVMVLKTSHSGLTNRSSRATISRWMMNYNERGRLLCEIPKGWLWCVGSPFWSWYYTWTY